MRHPRIIIASIGLAVVAAVGGVTAAAGASSPGSSVHPPSQSAAATVRTAPVAVTGKTETILVNAQGLPLYYYRPATGVSGKLTVLNDVNGHQVAYNGHLLYTFTSDHAGQVTGQGFQNFFVATPGLAPIARSSAPAGPVPAAPSGNGY